MARKPFWDDRKKKYDAHGCTLTSVPDELWTKHKDARIVDLSLNKITSIPSQMKELTVIEELSLKDNNLQIFPDAVCQLKSLKILNLESNSFTSISYNVVQLSQLQEVNLLKSGTPTFPRMICRIQSLKRLHFGFKDLPFRVTSLPDDVLITLPLEELYLYNCNLSMFPKVIFKIKTLKVLSLVWCKISDGLNNLGELSNLKQLTLSCNELTSLPESIGNLSPLEVLYANKNKLTSLPVVMKKLSKLKTIDLDDNPFCKGKSMACENKPSKVKSIISQAPVATGGQKQPVESQPKRSVDLQPKQTTSTTGMEHLKLASRPSSLNYQGPAQTTYKQVEKSGTKQTTTPTYGGSIASIFQTKQSNVQAGKSEAKRLETPLSSVPSSYTAARTDAMPLTPGKRVMSAPLYSTSSISAPQTKQTQPSSLSYPLQATTPTEQRQSSFLTKKSGETLPQQQKQNLEELQRQRQQQMKLQQLQRQHSKEVEVPGGRRRQP
ncbi:ras guanine nucleotide exchange factor V-like [Ptychodera flava]|uniref:ras guanine nucleotide exchange factor V-like n=1 Tax=Ptychodera flava TaxID=63121 RepID=UPI00396A99E5